jgi:hypothetical protein
VLTSSWISPMFLAIIQVCEISGGFKSYKTPHGCCKIRHADHS